MTTNPQDKREEELDETEATLTPEEAAKEYLEGWQRAQADFANLKKTHQAELTELRKYASRDLIEKLLPTIDSFQMAFGNKEAWEKVDQNWRTGVEYIYQQLWKTLEEEGLSVIDKTNTPFNPLMHQAVGQVETDDKSKDSVVLTIVSPGYQLNENVIRPAKVEVGHYQENNQ